MIVDHTTAERADAFAALAAAAARVRELVGTPGVLTPEEQVTVWECQPWKDGGADVLLDVELYAGSVAALLSGVDVESWSGLRD